MMERPLVSDYVFVLKKVRSKTHFTLGRKKKARCCGLRVGERKEKRCKDLGDKGLLTTASWVLSVCKPNLCSPESILSGHVGLLSGDLDFQE